MSCGAVVQGRTTDRALNTAGTRVEAARLAAGTQTAGCRSAAEGLQFPQHPGRSTDVLPVRHRLCRSGTVSWNRSRLRHRPTSRNSLAACPLQRFPTLRGCPRCRRRSSRTHVGSGGFRRDSDGGMCRTDPACGRHEQSAIRTTPTASTTGSLLERRRCPVRRSGSTGVRRRDGPQEERSATTPGRISCSSIGASPLMRSSRCSRRN